MLISANSLLCLTLKTTWVNGELRSTAWSLGSLSEKDWETGRQSYRSEQTELNIAFTLLCSLVNSWKIVRILNSEVTILNNTWTSCVCMQWGLHAIWVVLFFFLVSAFNDNLCFCCCLQHGVQLPGASWVLCHSDGLCQNHRDHDSRGPNLNKKQTE